MNHRDATNGGGSTSSSASSSSSALSSSKSTTGRLLNGTVPKEVSRVPPEKSFEKKPMTSTATSLSDDKSEDSDDDGLPTEKLSMRVENGKVSACSHFSLGPSMAGTLVGYDEVCEEKLLRVGLLVIAQTANQPSDSKSALIILYGPLNLK